MDKKTQGWRGNVEAHREAGKKGGKKTAKLYGKEFYRMIGKKGGLRKEENKNGI